MSPTVRPPRVIAVVGALILAAACGGNAPADPGIADARRGESAYLVASIACHGSAGEGIAGLGKPCPTPTSSQA